MTPQQFDDINLLPEKDNENILRSISALGISDKPFYIEVIPDIDAINGDCFVNVIKKVNTSKGEMILGWQFAEYSFMIEAEFHAVWKAPEGKLIDITPSADQTATKILFVIDHRKKFDGKRTDNFRFNTTSNELVDDMIEIEKAKFKLTNNTKEIDTTGRLIFRGYESIKWQEVNFIS